jgi:sulfur-carrier protein
LRIELRLYASLRKFLPAENAEGVCLVEMDEGASVRDVFAKIAVPPEAAKIVFLNGIHARGDEKLKDGDRVGAFPPVAGG